MTDYWINDPKYGASPSKSDNINEIKACIAACQAAGGSPAHRVRVPLGIFKHSNIIETQVSIVGVNSDPGLGDVSGFFAANSTGLRTLTVTRSSQAKPVTLEHLYFTGVPIPRNGSASGRNCIRVDSGSFRPDPSYWTIRNCYIDGPNKKPNEIDSLPNLGGIFIAGANNGLVERNTLLYTHADSIHITHGSRSHNIRVQYNRVHFAGDDSVAWVTYRSTNRIHHCITRYNDSYNSRHGRFYTSIGTSDCQILYNYGELTLNILKNKYGKAGIMVGQEGNPNDLSPGTYGTPGSVRLVVRGNTLKDVGGLAVSGGSGHGGIHQYTNWATEANPDWLHRDNLFENNDVISPRTWGIVVNGRNTGINTRVRNNRVYNPPEGRPIVSNQSDKTLAGFVSEGNTSLPLSAFKVGITPKGLGGAYSTNKHPVDGGESPTDPVDPTPEPPVEPPLPADAVIRTFQNGVSGYTGTVGTMLAQSDPAVNYAAAATWAIDDDAPAGSGQKRQVLIRFDNIFGTGPTQVPLGSEILKAELYLMVANGGQSASVYRMVRAWTAADTWNSMGNGVQTDGVDAVTAADLSTGLVTDGNTVLNLTSSVQVWSDGQPNRGWVMIAQPGSSDAWDFHGTAGETPPTLRVTYLPAAGTPPVDPQPPVETGTVTRTFENGVAGYASTSGTLLRENTPDTSYGEATLWTVDGDNPGGSGRKDQTLIRFGNIIGTGANQIPLRSNITSARLELHTTDGGHNAGVFRMLRDWASTDTWNSMVSGVFTDGIDAVTTADTTTGVTTSGSTSLNVSPSVQEWVKGAPNYGWALIAMQGSTDGWTFYGTSGSTKPKLTVTYIPPAQTEEEDKVIVSGQTPSARTTITFNASASDVVLRLHKTSAGTANVTNFRIERVPEIIWESGGPGSVSVGTNGAVAVTGTQGDATYGYHILASSPDRKYRLDLVVAGTSIDIKLGIDGELMAKRTVQPGPFSHEFVSIYDVVLWLEKSTAETSSVHSIALTEIAAHAWRTGGPGLVTVVDNTQFTMLPAVNTALTTCDRPFPTAPNREYTLTYTQVGDTISRAVGNSAPGDASISAHAVSAPGINTVRFKALANRVFPQFYKNTASAAITVSDIAFVQVPLEATTEWLVSGPGQTTIVPDVENITITGTGSGTTIARRNYSTAVGVKYKIRFEVTGGSIAYKFGTTLGGGDLRGLTTAPEGTVVMVFTASTPAVYLELQHVLTTTVTVSKPTFTLTDEQPTVDPVDPEDPDEPEEPGPVDPSDRAIVTAKVENYDTVASLPNQPMQAGTMFTKGDVPTGTIIVAKVGDTVIPSQLSNRIYWTDGSLKHAQARFLLPSIPAGGNITLTWVRRGGTWTAQDTALHSARTAITGKVSLEYSFPSWKSRTVSGTLGTEQGPMTFRSNDMLGATNATAGWVDTIMGGPVCSEWRASDLASISSGKHTNFGCWLYARAWGGTAGNPRYIQYLFKTMYGWDTRVPLEEEGLRLSIDLKVNATIIRGASVSTPGWSNVDSFLGGFVASVGTTGEMDWYDTQTNAPVTMPKLVYRHDITYAVRSRLVPPMDPSNPGMPMTITPSNYVPHTIGRLRPVQDDVADAQMIPWGVTQVHANCIGAMVRAVPQQLANHQQNMRVTAWGQGSLHSQGYNRTTRKVLCYLPTAHNRDPTAIGASIYNGTRPATLKDHKHNLKIINPDSAHFPQINLWTYQTEGDQHFLDAQYMEATLPGLFTSNAYGFFTSFDYKDENLQDISYAIGGISAMGQVRGVGHGVRPMLAAYGMGRPDDPNCKLAKAYLYHWCEASRHQPYKSTDWRTSTFSGGNTRTDGRRYVDLKLKDFATGGGGYKSWFHYFGAAALAYGIGLTDNDAVVREQAEWWAFHPIVMSGGYNNDTGPAYDFLKGDPWRASQYILIISGNTGQDWETARPYLPGQWQNFRSDVTYKADGQTVFYNTTNQFGNDNIVTVTGLIVAAEPHGVYDETKIPTGLTKNTAYWTVQANSAAKTFKLSATKGGPPVTFTTPGGVDLAAHALVTRQPNNPGTNLRPISDYQTGPNDYLPANIACLAFIRHFVYPEGHSEGPRALLAYRNVALIKQQIGTGYDPRGKTTVPF